MDEVIACLARDCPTKVYAATPPDLSKPGCSLIVCDEPARCADNDLFTDGSGSVWLYRAHGDSLRLAQLLTDLGLSAKNYDDASFAIRSATSRTVAGQHVLWLEWTSSDSQCASGTDGCDADETTSVTVCTQETPVPSCPLTLVERYSRTFTPMAPNVQAWKGSVTHAVEIAGDGVDVKLVKDEWPKPDPEEASSPPASDEIGQHPLRGDR